MKGVRGKGLEGRRAWRGPCTPALSEERVWRGRGLGIGFRVLGLFCVCLWPAACPIPPLTSLPSLRAPGLSYRKTTYVSRARLEEEKRALLSAFMSKGEGWGHKGRVGGIGR